MNVPPAAPVPAPVAPVAPGAVQEQPTMMGKVMFYVGILILVAIVGGGIAMWMRNSRIQKEKEEERKRAMMPPPPPAFPASPAPFK